MTAFLEVRGPSGVELMPLMDATTIGRAQGNSIVLDGPRAHACLPSRLHRSIDDPLALAVVVVISWQPQTSSSCSAREPILGAACAPPARATSSARSPGHVPGSAGAGQPATHRRAGCARYMLTRIVSTERPRRPLKSDRCSPTRPSSKPGVQHGRFCRSRSSSSRSSPRPAPARAQHRHLLAPLRRLRPRRRRRHPRREVPAAERVPQRGVQRPDLPQRLGAARPTQLDDAPST